MPRVGLTRETVIAQALAIADADGLQALTMRRLAAELDVEAMSLYNHVKNKADLHTGIADRVWEEVDLASDETDWRAALMRMCASAHHALVSHPWFFELPAALGGVPRVRVIDAQLRYMREAGVPVEVAYHAQHVIDGHITGYSWEVIEFADDSATARRAEEVFAQINPDEMPHLVEHANQHFEGPPPGDGFEIGLSYILDGVAASIVD